MENALMCLRITHTYLASLVTLVAFPDAKQNAVDYEILLSDCNDNVISIWHNRAGFFGHVNHVCF